MLVYASYTLADGTKQPDPAAVLESGVNHQTPEEIMGEATQVGSIDEDLTISMGRREKDLNLRLFLKTSTTIQERVTEIDHRAPSESPSTTSTSVLQLEGNTSKPPKSQRKKSSSGGWRVASKTSDVQLTETSRPTSRTTDAVDPNPVSQDSLNDISIRPKGRRNEDQIKGWRIPHITSGPQSKIKPRLAWRPIPSMNLTDGDSLSFGKLSHRRKTCYYTITENLGAESTVMNNHSSTKLRSAPTRLSPVSLVAFLMKPLRRGGACDLTMTVTETIDHPIAMVNNWITIGSNTVTVRTPLITPRSPTPSPKPTPVKRTKRRPTSTCYFTTITMTDSIVLPIATTFVTKEIANLARRNLGEDELVQRAQPEPQDLQAKYCHEGGTFTITEHIAMPKTVTATVLRTITKHSTSIQPDSRKSTTLVQTRSDLTGAGNAQQSSYTQRETIFRSLPSKQGDGHEISTSKPSPTVRTTTDDSGQTVLATCSQDPSKPSSSDLIPIYTMIEITSQDPNGIPTQATSILVFASPTQATFMDSRGCPTEVIEYYVLNYPRATTIARLGGDHMIATSYYLVTSKNRLSNEDGRPASMSTVVHTKVLSLVTLTNGEGEPTRTVSTLVGTSFPGTTSVSATPSTTPTPTPGPDNDRTIFHVYAITTFEYVAGLVLPTFIATTLAVLMRILDSAAKLYHPFFILASTQTGAPAKESIYWESSGPWSFLKRFQQLRQGQALLAITGSLVVISAVLVPISAETIRVTLQGDECHVGQGNADNCAITLGVFFIPSYISISLLAVMGVLLIAFCIIVQRRRSGVYADPWTLREITRWSSHPSMQLLLHHVSLRNEKTDSEYILQLFDKKVFALKHWQDVDGTKYGIIPNDRKNVIPVTHGGDTGVKELLLRGKKRYDRKKISFNMLTIWARLLLVFILAGLLVVILTYNLFSSGLDDFLSGETITVRLFITSMGVVISLSWSSYFHYADTKVSPGEDRAPVYAAAMEIDYEGKPTEEELATLRRVPGKLPLVAYLLCAVEFCERASYYGCQGLYSNFVNRPLPQGGNGWGAPPPGSQKTPGALGMGEVKANAVGQSVSLIAYALPLVTGYLADTKTGRFKMIFWGIFVMGLGHIILLVSGAKSLLESGNAKGPFFAGVYILSIGSAMFKPNLSPLLLDQMTTHVPKVITLKSGECVIEDPEHGTERAMLWFYLLINVGGFMQVATSYSEKYIGWWLAWLLPLLLYIPLPLLMWFLKKRLVLHKPGGSDLPNVMIALGHCLKGGGILRIGRKGFWERAKPSYQAAHGLTVTTRYSDQFVEDVRRTFQATGMFCFFPVQYWNDNGLANAASYLSTMLRTDGAPNDVMNNFNSLSIIIFSPILNFGLYPFLRKTRIHYGPVMRICTGFFLSTLGGVAYTVLQYYAYKTSPCGMYGSSDPTCVDNGLTSPIPIWWMGIPYSIGGISELFINVPAYGIAYSRAPVNMRGLVSAINLFNTAIAYIVNLACSSAVADPHLIWDFGGPAILGGVVTVVFWILFKHIDKEEYVLTAAAEATEVETDGSTHIVAKEAGRN
ncbi:putative peptide transporter ptr2 protein [Paramyrothecium foliicola]|nr:putative peptide transporter ptr2 protein [Paramyrothecium foliicola]